MEQVALAGVGGIVMAAIAAFGFFYKREYNEQREFRGWVYDAIHQLDKKLERNCVITQRIEEQIKGKQS